MILQANLPALLNGNNFEYMPSGKTHDKINFLTSPPIFLGSYLLSHHSMSVAALVTLSALFAGYMLGPDLDTKSNQYYRWGILRFIWVPFRKLFKHRSKYTHTPIISTMTILLYLLCFAFMVYGLYRLVYPQEWVESLKDVISVLTLFWNSHQPDAYAVAAGLILGSSIHIVTDYLVSFYKRLVRFL